MRQAIGATKSVGERGRIAVAVAGLVEGEHHVTAAGKFDGKAILRFPRIDVAVNRENAGRRGLRRRVRRDVEQGAHGVALGALETHILDLDAAGSLRQVGQQSADEDENKSGDRQRPSAAHGSHPFFRAVEPAFGFALVVIDTVSEG